MTTYGNNDTAFLDGTVPITITSKALKKGKPDKIALSAICCQLSTPCNALEKTFIPRITSRDFQRRRFPLEPGCMIVDNTGSYECTAVSYTNRPKYPILTARLANNESSLCSPNP